MFLPFPSPPLLPSPYLSLYLPFLFPVLHASLLVHSQSRLCSPLRSLFSSLQAPVPKSFCQSLRPSSTTWYKLHSPFCHVHVWPVSVVCLWAPSGTKQLHFLEGRVKRRFFLSKGLAQTELYSILVASSQHFRHRKTPKYKRGALSSPEFWEGNKTGCCSNLDPSSLSCVHPSFSPLWTCMNAQNPVHPV